MIFMAFTLHLPSEDTGMWSLEPAPQPGGLVGKSFVPKVLKDPMVDSCRVRYGTS